MAENYSQQYRGKVIHVYLGEGKADTLYNKHMQELLEQSDVLPEAYRDRIAALLQVFDRHSREREMGLRKRLNDAYTRFEQQLGTFADVMPAA